jgi:MFS family permease
MRSTPLLRDLPREVAVLTSVSFCVALGFGIVAPVLPVFARSFDVSATQASAVIAIFALVRFIAAVPAGWLNDRLGERLVLAVGIGIVAASSFLAGLSNSYVQLLALRGVGGFGSAMFTVSSLALLLRVTEPNQRGRAAGAFQGGFLLGGITGPAIGGLVVAWSIRAPFFVYAATLTVAVIVVVTLLARVQLSDHPESETPEAVTSPETGWQSLRRALRSRPYVTALAVNLGNGFVAFGLRAALVPLFVTEALRYGPTWVGFGFLVAAGVQGLLLLPAGRVADTRGRRTALVIGTAAVTTGMLVLAFVENIVGFFVTMAVLGFGSAFLGSAPAAVVGDVVGEGRRGTIVAAFQMTSDLGAIAGPLTAGLIYDSTGSFTLAFLTGAFVSMIGFALAVTMPETAKPAEVESDQ